MLIRFLLSFALVLAAFGQSIAQDFPTKPIRIVIPYAPGGGSDILRSEERRVGKECA